MRIHILTLAELVAAVAAGAAPAAEVSIRLAGGPSFREGELIRAEVLVPGAAAVPGKPPSSRWQFGGFLLDPPGECGRLDSPCLLSMAFGFDKTDPVLRIGERGAPVALWLNHYLPALRPERYRVTVLARQLVLMRREGTATTYSYGTPARYAASNTVEFEVVPATAAWVDETIDAAVAVLRGPQPDGPGAWERHQAAAAQLRHLDYPRAWRASLDLLPTEEYTLLRGLMESREQARVCELIETRLAAPEQSVSSYYLTALAQVCKRAGAPAGASEARLAASLPGKSNPAKIAGLQTLLEGELRRRANEPGRPQPAWIPTVKTEFVKVFPEMEVWRRRMMLSLYTTALRSPDVIPLLESVLDGWKPGDYYEAPHEAIAGLYMLDPPRAQARIRAEILKARTWLDTPQLEMLPTAAARFTDDELIAALADAQRAGGWNVQLRMAALAKYASPRALPRLTAIFESQQDTCQPELMAYFLRVDPAYADRVFHSHPWDMQQAPPRCTLQYFERTPRIAMAPPLEKYMAAYLMHGIVWPKRVAAQTLGRYGTPAALPALWGAFRYFHEYWKGKQDELEENQEGVWLEVELRNAIARGRNWLAPEAELRTIEALCISARCRQETAQDLTAWKPPLHIEVGEEAGGIRGTVAQYYGIESIEAMNRKLAQFPRGTRFTLRAWGGAEGEPAARIRRFAASHGLAVE